MLPTKLLFPQLARCLVRGVFSLVCRTKIIYFADLPTGTGYIRYRSVDPQSRLSSSGTPARRHLEPDNGLVGETGVWLEAFLRSSGVTGLKSGSLMTGVWQM